MHNIQYRFLFCGLPFKLNLVQRAGVLTTCTVPICTKLHRGYSRELISSSDILRVYLKCVCNKMPRSPKKDFPNVSLAFNNVNSDSRRFSYHSTTYILCSCRIVIALLIEIILQGRGNLCRIVTHVSDLRLRHKKPFPGHTASFLTLARRTVLPKSPSLYLCANHDVYEQNRDR